MTAGPAAGRKVEEPLAGRWLARSKWIVLALLVVLLVVLPYAVSSFWVGLATQALIFGLFALSINILAGFGGMITLGQAGLLGVAAYGVAILTTKSGWPLGAAIAGALVACLLVSAFFGLLVARVRGTYFVMVTLAEGMLVWGVAQRWQGLTGGENGITGVPKPAFAEEYWQYYYLVLVVVAACTVLIGRLVRSPFGLSIKGIREAEDRLSSLGYSVALHKFLAFTVSGVFAGVAGVLLAMYNNFIGPSDVFFLASAKGLFMSILGGVATLPGAFVGSSIVIFIQNDVSSYVERWQTLLGAVFVIVILFAPDGVVGAWMRWVWAPLLRRAGAVREAAAADAAAAAQGSVVGAATATPASADEARSSDASGVPVAPGPGRARSP